MSLPLSTEPINEPYGPSNEKIQDYGVHRHEYYELNISFIQSPLDVSMINNWKESPWFSQAFSVSYSRSDLLFPVMIKYLTELAHEINVHARLLAEESAHNSMAVRDGLSLLQGDFVVLKSIISHFIHDK